MFSGAGHRKCSQELEFPKPQYRFLTPETIAELSEYILTIDFLAVLMDDTDSPSSES